MYAASLALFISEICYTLTMAFVKLSILAFYWRSFSVHLWIKWSTVVLGISVLMWAVAVVCCRIHLESKSVVLTDSLQAHRHISPMPTFTSGLGSTWFQSSIGYRRRLLVQGRRCQVLLRKRYSNHRDRSGHAGPPGALHSETAPAKVPAVFSRVCHSTRGVVSSKPEKAHQECHALTRSAQCHHRLCHTAVLLAVHQLQGRRYDLEPCPSGRLDHC
jgi:hypothetical protein